MSILPQQPYVSVITPSQGDRQYYLRQCGDSIDMICFVLVASPSTGLSRLRLHQM